MNKKLVGILLAGGIVLSSVGKAFACTQEEMNSIIAEAESKIGLPYVWGANPNSEVQFDCSSLMKHLYSHIDVELPRCSYEQAMEGQAVSLEEVEPGDIICMRTSSRNDWTNGVTHVGIAINNTEMVHAKGRRYGVVKQDIADYASKIVTIRRIVETKEITNKEGTK